VVKGFGASNDCVLMVFAIECKALEETCIEETYRPYPPVSCPSLNTGALDRTRTTRNGL
jgi:hypothetical protein